MAIAGLFLKQPRGKQQSTITNGDEKEPYMTGQTEQTQTTEDIKINVQIGDKSYTVTMFDNPAVDELLSQLPMTLEFSDYNGQEKGAKAPTPLKMDGVPQNDRGHLNDFIYYQPSNSLVFCYTDIGSWNGIVRLGSFDSSIEDIKNLPDGFAATIERIN